MDYVDLDRRFRAVRSEQDSETAALDSYTTLATTSVPESGWPEILTRQRVVVLGEPGSGKSREFRHRAETLKKHHKMAFYLRLDELVDEAPDALLEADELRRLKVWIKSRESAFFFLDSVDEAKLRRSTDFGRALRRLQAFLGQSALKRASILISSRISEWRPQTDAHDVLRILSGFDPTTISANKDGALQVQTTKEPSLYVVQIAPLDESRVKQFAEALGVDEVDAFIAAVQQNHAWVFARRPLDVLGLVRFWRERGRLGSLAEMVEFDVALKLAESESRSQSDPLTPGRARLGAETLAASVTLCRSLTFRVADDEPDVEGTGLNAQDCL